MTNLENFNQKQAEDTKEELKRLRTQYPDRYKNKTKQNGHDNITAKFYMDLDRYWVRNHGSHFFSK